MKLHFVGGATEILSGVMAPDWFDNGGAALVTDGGVFSDGFIQAVGQNPRLYQSDVFLSNTSGLIQSLEFTYAGGTGHTVVFGVSGIPVPEPTAAAAALLSVASARRRRRRPVASLSHCRRLRVAVAVCRVGDPLPALAGGVRGRTLARCQVPERLLRCPSDVLEAHPPIPWKRAR